MASAMEEARRAGNSDPSKLFVYNLSKASQGWGSRQSRPLHHGALARRGQRRLDLSAAPLTAAPAGRRR